MSHRPRPASWAARGQQRDLEPGEVGGLRAGCPTHRWAPSPPRSRRRSRSPPFPRRAAGSHRQHNDWNGQNRQHGEWRGQERSWNRGWQHGDRCDNSKRWGSGPQQGAPSVQEPGELVEPSKWRMKDGDTSQKISQAGDSLRAGSDRISKMIPQAETVSGTAHKRADLQSVDHQHSGQQPKTKTSNMADEKCSQGESINGMCRDQEEAGPLRSLSGPQGDERQARMQRLKSLRWGTQPDGRSQTLGDVCTLGNEKMTMPEQLPTERPAVQQLQKWKDVPMCAVKAAAREGSSCVVANADAPHNRTQPCRTDLVQGCDSDSALSKMYSHIVGKAVMDRSLEIKQEFEPIVSSEADPVHKPLCEDYPITLPEILHGSLAQSPIGFNESAPGSSERAVPQASGPSSPAPHSSPQPLWPVVKVEEKEEKGSDAWRLSTMRMSTGKERDYSDRSSYSHCRSLSSDVNQDRQTLRRSLAKTEEPRHWGQDIWIAGQPYRRPVRPGSDVWRSSDSRSNGAFQRSNTVRSGPSPHGSRAASGGEVIHVGNVQVWRRQDNNEDRRWPLPHRAQSSRGEGWQRERHARMDPGRQWHSEWWMEPNAAPRPHSGGRYRPMMRDYQNAPMQPMGDHRRQCQPWSAQQYRPQGQQCRPPLPPEPPPDQPTVDTLQWRKQQQPASPNTPVAPLAPRHPGGGAPPLPPDDPPPPEPEPGGVPPGSSPPPPPPPPGSPPRGCNSDMQIDHVGVAVSSKEKEMQVEGEAMSDSWEQDMAMRANKGWACGPLPVHVGKKTPSQSTSQTLWYRNDNSSSAWSHHSDPLDWQGQHSQSPEWRKLGCSRSWRSCEGSCRGPRGLWGNNSSVPATPPESRFLGHDNGTSKMSFKREFNQRLKMAMTKGFKRMSKIFGGRDIPGQFRVRLARRMFHAASHECDNDFYCTSTDEEDGCGEKKLRVTMGMRLQAKRYLEKMVGLKGRKNKNRLCRMHRQLLPFVAEYNPNTLLREENYPAFIPWKPGSLFPPFDNATDPRPRPLGIEANCFLQIPTLSIDHFAFAIKEDEKRKQALAAVPRPAPRVPPESGAFHYINHRGSLSYTAYKLDALRSMAAAGEGPVMGSSVWRADDDLWLPLRQEPYTDEELKSTWQHDQDCCPQDPEEHCRIRVAQLQGLRSSAGFIRAPDDVLEAADVMKVLLVVTENCDRPVRIVVVPSQPVLGLISKKIGSSSKRNGKWFAETSRERLRDLLHCTDNANRMGLENAVHPNVESQLKSKDMMLGRTQAVLGLQHRAQFAGEVFKKAMGHKGGTRLRECARKVAVAAFADAGLAIRKSNLKTAGSVQSASELIPDRQESGDANKNPQAGKKRTFDIMSLVESATAFASRKRRQ